MKTKPLTFLLALTFLFMFSGSSVVFSNDLQDGLDAHGLSSGVNSRHILKLVNNERFLKFNESNYFSFKYPESWKLFKIPSPAGELLLVMDTRDKNHNLGVTIHPLPWEFVRGDYKGFSNKLKMTEHFMNETSSDHIKGYAKSMDARDSSIIERKILDWNDGIKFFMANTYNLNEGFSVNGYNIFAVPYNRKYIITFMVGSNTPNLKTELTYKILNSFIVNK